MPSAILEDGAPLFGERLVAPLLAIGVSGANDVTSEDRGTWLPVVGYTDYVIPLVGKVDGCKADIIKARLLFAENSKIRIDGVPGEPVDLKKEFLEIKALREVEAAAQAEEDRKAAEAQAKKDTADTLRYSFNPAIITSSGCIGDFVKMKSLEGVAQRKLIADMIDTGCMVFLKASMPCHFRHLKTQPVAARFL